MQEVYPAQAHLSIDFISFFIDYLIELLLVSFHSYDSFHLLGNGG